jgi:hypothetical protein
MGRRGCGAALRLFAAVMAKVDTSVVGISTETRPDHITLLQLGGEKTKGSVKYTFISVHSISSLVCIL